MVGRTARLQSSGDNPEIEIMLMMEHRTPLGLEIRMYGKEAKRVLGVRINKNEHDETEEELRERFARALAIELGATNPIALVYSVKHLKNLPDTSPAERKKRAPRAIMPTLNLPETAAIPRFLTEPKK
jgi:hypothetical protein